MAVLEREGWGGGVMRNFCFERGDGRNCEVTFEIGELKTSVIKTLKL